MELEAAKIDTFFTALDLEYIFQSLNIYTLSVKDQSPCFID